eukprot:4376373-Amphidinium_carterae.1
MIREAAKARVSRVWVLAMLAQAFAIACPKYKWIAQCPAQVAQEHGISNVPKEAAIQTISSA